jgi:hypothetical protein
LGYGGFQGQKRLLHNYIRYDTLFIALQYLSYALIGLPYMGVGRNLAYRKSLFFKNKGFASHYDLLSGDDDLFVNETATRQNVAINISKKGFTRSTPLQSFAQWRKQKRRHLTTSNRYKFKHKFLLGLEVFSRLCFYLLLAALILLNFKLEIVLSIAGFRLLLQLVVVKCTMVKLKEKNIWLSAVIFDLLSLFINFIIYVSTSFSSNKVQWK